MRSNGFSVIGVVSPKGGVGKSTIADQLAFDFSDMGFQVAVCDADPQQSSLFHRSVAVPDCPDIVIVDTRGVSDTGLVAEGRRISIDDIIAECDLVLIPTLLEYDSLDPLQRAVGLCVGACIPYLVVVNQCVPQTRLARELDGIIRSRYAGHVWPGYVSRTVAVGVARRFGLPVCKVDAANKVVGQFRQLACDIGRILANGY